MSPLNVLINLLRFGLTAAIIALAVLGGMHVLRNLEEEEPPRTFERGDERTDLAFLPMTPVEASEILGHSREAVRLLLGELESSGPSSDVFNGPPRFTIRYLDGVAVSLSLSTRNAGVNQRQVRHWLRLPKDGGVVLDGVEYQVLAPDRDEVVVEQKPAKPEVKSVVERRRRWLSAQLLKEFPRIPPDFAAECRSESIGAGALFCLANADARLLYDLDSDHQARVLTVLDPPQVTSLEECRAFLKDAFPAADLTAVVDEPGLLNRYFAAPGKRFAAIWNDASSGAPSSCAIVACVESSDPQNLGHSPCLPRE